MKKIIFAEKIILMILLAIILFSTIVLAENDPGHDILYIEQQGDSELNGSLNVTGNVSIKDIIFSGVALDIRGDDEQTGTNNRIVGINGAGLSIQSIGNIYINTLSGPYSTVYLGDSAADSVNINITGALFFGSNGGLNVSSGTEASSDLYWGDKLICDASETNCGWVTSAIGGGDVTGVYGDNIYIWNGNTSGEITLVLNETKLNATIDARATSTGDGNNYTTSIGFSTSGATETLNLAITGRDNLTAQFTNTDTTYTADDIYLYLSTLEFTFNETMLNNTINARTAAFNETNLINSVNTSYNIQVLGFLNTTIIDATNTAQNNTLLSEVGARVMNATLYSEVGARAMNATLMSEVGARVMNATLYSEVGARTMNATLYTEVGARMMNGSLDLSLQGMNTTIALKASTTTVDATNTAQNNTILSEVGARAMNATVNTLVGARMLNETVNTLVGARMVNGSLDSSLQGMNTTIGTKASQTTVDATNTAQNTTIALKALTGNCPEGEYVENTTTSGVECSAVAASGDGNNYTTAISVDGTTTKTINLARTGMANLTAQFTDIDTDQNNYTTSIGFSTSGATETLNLAITGRDNLTAQFTDTTYTADDTYLYLSTLQFTFNETKLNNTINLRAAAYNETNLINSVNTSSNIQVLGFFNTTIIDATNTAQNNTLLSEVGARVMNATLYSEVGARAMNATLMSEVGARAMNATLYSEVGARTMNATLYTEVGARMMNGSLDLSLQGMNTTIGLKAATTTVDATNTAQNNTILLEVGARAMNATLMSEVGARAMNATLLLEVGARAMNATVLSLVGARMINGSLDLSLQGMNTTIAGKTTQAIVDATNTAQNNSITSINTTYNIQILGFYNSTYSDARYQTGTEQNNYTTSIGFSTSGATETLNMQITGRDNLTAQFTDTDTTYTNSTGLILTGTAFSVQDYYLFNTGDTATGNYTFGTSIFLDGTNNKIGIGTVLPLAQLHLNSTSNQLRISYDDSNYGNISVNSGGNLTIKATGHVIIDLS